MSVSKDVYVCGICGYHAENSAGRFKEKESPHSRSIVCFGCKTDTPPVILEKDFLNAICQHTGCTETREKHIVNNPLIKGKFGFTHEFVSP